MLVCVHYGKILPTPYVGGNVLKGSEKALVARHEASHAVVGTAVANLLAGQPHVEVNHGKCSIFGH